MPNFQRGLERCLFLIKPTKASERIESMKYKKPALQVTWPSAAGANILGGEFYTCHPHNWSGCSLFILLLPFAVNGATDWGEFSPCSWNFIHSELSSSAGVFCCEDKCRSAVFASVRCLRAACCCPRWTRTLCPGVVQVYSRPAGQGDICCRRQ